MFLSQSWFIFCKQRTACELRISDWSSDVCSSDLRSREEPFAFRPSRSAQREVVGRVRIRLGPQRVVPPLVGVVGKTLSLHRVTQQMPVATLRGGHIRR